MIFKISKFNIRRSEVWIRTIAKPVDEMTSYFTSSDTIVSRTNIWMLQLENLKVLKFEDDTLRCFYIICNVEEKSFSLIEVFKHLSFISFFIYLCNDLW